MSEREMEMGEVVRKCRICNQSFALQQDLLKHLKEAHGVKSYLSLPRIDWFPEDWRSRATPTS